VETLEYNKNRFRKNYSEELTNMISYMLGEDANSRPEWIELENYVITDTSKSFINEGRKSNIFTQSKPTSVNVIQKTQIYDGIQNGSNSQIGVNGSSGVVLPPKKTGYQKPILEQKQQIYTASSAVNKGIGISSLKPMSVQNLSNQQIHTSTFVPFYPG
jgi:hypothetical protein